MTVVTKTQRLWEIDDFAAVQEHITGDPQHPSVFGLQFRANPLTRPQLTSLRDALNEVLNDVPERRVTLLADLTPPNIPQAHGRLG